MASIPTLTVRETLMFAAQCRMARTFTYAERSVRVDEVMGALDLRSVEDSRVGDELVRGISTGERKRMEVAIELVARPRILFLDEVTSGLDAYTARVTVDMVLGYAKLERVAVVCVLHQPSQSIFRMFDNCLLLSGGRTCFFGPVADADDFFRIGGYVKSGDVEQYLQTISDDPAGIANFYARSPLAAANEGFIRRLLLLNQNGHDPEPALRYARSFWMQLRAPWGPLPAPVLAESVDLVGPDPGLSPGRAPAGRHLLQPGLRYHGPDQPIDARHEPRRPIGLGRPGLRAPVPGGPGAVPPGARVQHVRHRTVLAFVPRYRDRLHPHDIFPRDGHHRPHGRIREQDRRQSTP
ncbi:P-loop containing nucleoside triphosphate hydrolase protein [Hyaloraphidium curvatum]|nr:P-loop containing nucleoside triphosphate hydrolase protein [Hyaloraphidium curvatum]